VWHREIFQRALEPRREVGRGRPTALRNRPRLGQVCLSGLLEQPFDLRGPGVGVLNLLSRSSTASLSSTSCSFAGDASMAPEYERRK
jgi:hypothetical protein